MLDAAKTLANSALSDEEVVQRVCAGEHGLFEILMRRHNQRLYRAIRAILRREEEVEDVMQQAYMSAFSHLQQFNATAKLSTWLTKIAINEACGRLRRRQPQVVAVEGELVDMNPQSPEDQAADRELGGLLEKSVDRLPEMYRTVFMLREIEGLDTKDTAEALSVSEEVVKTRLHRGKELLQKDLINAMQSRAMDAFPFHAVRCDRVVSAVLSQLVARR